MAFSFAYLVHSRATLLTCKTVIWCSQYIWCLYHFLDLFVSWVTQSSYNFNYSFTKSECTVFGSLLFNSIDQKSSTVEATILTNHKLLTVLRFTQYGLSIKVNLF